MCFRNRDQTMNHRQAYIMLVSVMILWTSGIVVAKTIGDTISVLEFSLWRWVFAAAFLFPFSFRGLNKSRCQIRKKKWKIFLLGVFLAGGSSLLVWSVQKTSVMNAALLSATQPIVTVGLFWILLSQKLRKIQFFQHFDKKIIKFPS